MARRAKVKLNRRQMAERLKDDDVRDEVRDLAERAKANIEGMGFRVHSLGGGQRKYELPVAIESQTTDRVREVVVLDHPAGQAVEAKHGALVRAASSVGLEVKGRG